MYTVYKQSRMRAGGYEDCEADVKHQEKVLEDYIYKDQFAFGVHMETSRNFRKILMRVALERGHVHVARYCALKAKQERAKKNCEEAEKCRCKYPHHPTDAELLRRQKAAHVLIHTEHHLHTLQAKALAHARPDDPGLRVLYERALAGLAVEERRFKEIEEFSNPLIYNGPDHHHHHHHHHTESTRRGHACHAALRAL